MRQGKVTEIIDEINTRTAAAEGFIGMWNATPEELDAIAKFRAAQASGSADDVVLALAAVGLLQRCPPSFWREIRRAAHLTGVTPPSEGNG